MPTPIVVLSECDGPVAPPPGAEAYAALLAKTMAVPLRLLRVVPAAAGQVVAAESVAAVLAQQDALLLVMRCPTGADPPSGWLATAVWSLLQTVRPPLLLVPGDLADQAPPRRIALVADGDPFTLVHGQRAMHGLLLTLPIQLTVLHAPVPESAASAADALQTVLACGLAARYLTAAATLVVPAPGAVAGILAGARQVGADLLVLIIRQASLVAAGFSASPLAVLARQSPVPVLLLLATD